MLAITGMQETQLLGTGYQQEVHLEKLYADVAEYDVMIHDPTQMPTVVDLAIRHALARRTVSHITFPNDIQIAAADENPWAEVAPARPPATAPIFLPGPRGTRRQRPAAGGRGAERGQQGGAARRGRRAACSRPSSSRSPSCSAARSSRRCPARPAVPDDRPLTTGGIGLLGTRPSEDAMEEIDTLFMVGTNFPYTKHLPPPGQVRTVQIEADPVRRRQPDADRSARSSATRRDPAGAAAAAAPQGRPLVPGTKPERHARLAGEDVGAGERRLATRSRRST